MPVSKLKNPVLLILLLANLLLLVLLIPYIGHYYYLENTVQKLYLLYNQAAALEDRIAYPNTQMMEKL